MGVLLTEHWRHVSFSEILTRYGRPRMPQFPQNYSQCFTKRCFIEMNLKNKPHNIANKIYVIVTVTNSDDQPFINENIYKYFSFYWLLAWWCRNIHPSFNSKNMVLVVLPFTLFVFLERWALQCKSASRQSNTTNVPEYFFVVDFVVVIANKHTLVVGRSGGYNLSLIDCNYQHLLESRSLIDPLPTVNFLRKSMRQSSKQFSDDQFPYSDDGTTRRVFQWYCVLEEMLC